MDGLSFLYSNSSAPLRPVKFVPAQRADRATVPQDIDIVRLNDEATEQPSGDMPRPANGRHAKDGHAELFREEELSRSWTVAHKRVGAGLQNLGNTCFMNSVLQCLTHTPPLAEALLRYQGANGFQKGFDALRTTQEHVGKALQGRSAVLSPVSHAKSLKLLNRSFRVGRQEDAHEYLIALLDAMHENLLAGLRPKPPPSVQQTSMIFRIFAGRIRSQVKCTECGFESNTSDAFLDVSLEINRAQSLERALQRFTAIEYLEGENKYRCPRENRMVRAAKRMAFEKAPCVLLLHLKRFEYSMYGQKITKKVDYGTTLDLAPYMSDRRSPPQLYELYAVLVHCGHSVHSGHYYCYVRAPNGLWHQMDDSSVSQVSERVVLAQKAYILFYIRKEGGAGNRDRKSRESASAAPSGRAADSAPVKRPAAAPPAEAPLHKRPFQARSVEEGRSNSGGGLGAEEQEALHERRASHVHAGPSREAEPPQKQRKLRPPLWEANRLLPSKAASGADEVPSKGDSKEDSVLGIANPSAAPPAFTPFSIMPAAKGGRERVARLAASDSRLAAQSLHKGKSFRRFREAVKYLGRQGSALLGTPPLKGSSPPLKGASPPLKGSSPPPKMEPAVARSRSDLVESQQEASGSDAPKAEPEAPAQPSPGMRAKRRTTDTLLVQHVLGVDDQQGSVGPAGEAVWADPGDDARPAVREASRTETGQRGRLDEYDREYDRGKTKKVRGIRAAATWQDGNAFQRAQDMKRPRREDGGWGHSNGRSNRHRRSRR